MGWTITACGRFCHAVFGGVFVFEILDFPGVYGYYAQDDFGNLVPCRPVAQCMED